ncbi:MAG: malonyl-CoA decarboxylase [Tistlia sp.]|uniref:malonyl-CoA decarboxylase n=1 Tax=Tistlia sp. TaxID=3057121 RepID=UPI0034A26CCE
MAEAVQQSFFDRTLTNLSTAWRDVAASAARSVGLTLDAPGADPDALRTMMRDCLEARGGEVSARAPAAPLGPTNLQLDPAGRNLFLRLLAEDFAVDREAVDRAVARLSEAGEGAGRARAERALRRALVPPRLKLLTQFNGLPEGVKFLADLRADLLATLGDDAALKSLDDDLYELLSSWFDTGFLDLERIDWNSSAALLEKLIAYEAVHEIRDFYDLRNRLDSDRRCYALFHPRMPKEPLAFVEVALVQGLAGSIQALLDETAPQGDPGSADTAIFYSISNTQKGLKGISLGEYLIKMVVRELGEAMPRVRTFGTLSPVPGFRRWLAGVPAEELNGLLSVEERGGIRALGGSDSTPESLAALLDRADWMRDPVIARALEEPLLRLMAKYFTVKRDDGQPIDPVARFHLRNGARLERLNWLADVSDKGLKQAAGMMVNYRYLPDELERNHDAYVSKGTVAMAAEVRGLVRKVRGDGSSTLRRLGLGTGR